MQYDNQDETQHSNPASKPATPTHKTANPAADPTQQPAWTQAMRDQPPPGLQAKLTINQPGDPYEQEADRIADQVMRTPTTETPTVPADPSLMRKESTGAQTTQSAPPIVNQALNSGGQPLDPSTRATMEPRFGQDFSQVKVHTDEQAAESAQAVSAKAYTVGKDVVFGPGQYAPGTSEGQRLLAHELTHVVQQQRSTSAAYHNKQAIPAAQIDAQPFEGVVFRAVEGIAVADILDYDRLANQIHTAIAGLGTDEEAVYRALQSLQREPAAITKLQQTYRARYHETLESAIRDDFSGSELEYALQLLNMGTASSPQAIKSAPLSSPDFQTSARRIREAVEGWGTDEEAIYAVLTPLQRNSQLIRQLSNAYFSLYNEDLRERIVDEMSGSELDYALYLMGEQRMETTDISIDEATRLFNALSHATFVTAAGTREPVPFHYPIDGCYDRAYVMTNILTQMGYASEKVFAVSKVSTPVSVVSGLHVPTDYAVDAPTGTPAVKWWYHVAPVIRVRGTPGPGEQQAPSVERVMDPSLFDHPVKISDWTDKTSSGARFTRLNMAQLEAELQAHGGDYPVDKPLVFTTDRNVYYPSDASATPPTASKADTQHTANLTTMTTYGDLSRIHEIAAAIRAALRIIPVSVDTIVNAIRAAPAAARLQLWSRFPNLHQQVLAAIPDPAAELRIEDAVTQP